MKSKVELELDKLKNTTINVSFCITDVGWIQLSYKDSECFSKLESLKKQTNWKCYTFEPVCNFYIDNIKNDIY